MSDLPVDGEALDDAWKSAEPNECVRCHKAQSDGFCCSSHLKQLCHRCYRVTHFVEVCGCETCIEQGIPRIYPEPKAEARAITNKESACSSCSAAIVWAKAAKSARSMPLNAATVPPETAGALILIQGWAYAPADLREKLARRLAVSTARADTIMADDYDWHLSHFATCPAAAAHRRTRPA